MFINFFFVIIIKGKRVIDLGMRNMGNRFDDFINGIIRVEMITYRVM
ncbi:hypothetical protein GWO43_21100 [candidate division KSB1 bacterium]|nr:hypothetical protein [candidate division KSB1 bacterium]NIR72051.1 hypothetical protein [candidate division KSB1 bacterium]NIS26564.1 hypothetical protein [candidate division KSB1 bacterium]NIT73326.1 hypothetical protein [candidate division KSB1 bacterium]NIU27174.1 hypothetical protein [candidate division KSB1 bacterium]